MRPSSSSHGTLSPRTTGKDAVLAAVLTQLQAWDDDDNPNLRAQRLQTLEALLNGPYMLDVVQSLPPRLMGYAFAVPSVRAKLMVNPVATLDWMRDHTNIGQSQVLSFLQDWEEKDPTAVQASLTALPAGDWKQNAIATAANEALSSDPLATITWARQMNPGTQQSMLLQMATTAWAKSDPQAAAEWAGQVGDPNLRAQLYAALAIGSAESDPLDSAQWLVQSVPAGPLQNQTAAQIAGSWALQDATAAAQWVADFPEGQARQLALASVINAWGNHDPGGVTRWVATLPEGSLRTEATALLATLPVPQ